MVKCGRRLKYVWKTIFGIMDAIDYLILAAFILGAIAAVIYGSLKWVAE